LILREIIKTVANECQILRLKCTKIDFSWGSAPDHAEEVYIAPQTLNWNKGDLLLRGKKGCKEGKE